MNVRAEPVPIRMVVLMIAAGLVGLVGWLTGWGDWLYPIVGILALVAFISSARWVTGQSDRPGTLGL